MLTAVSLPCNLSWGQSLYTCETLQTTFIKTQLSRTLLQRMFNMILLIEIYLREFLIALKPFT